MKMNCKCKPDFFIVGMPRSGTTSMYTYLKQHPDIYLAVYKEPNFFCKDLTQSFYNIQEQGLYDSLFAHAKDKKRIGEGSVWYLTSKIAAVEIKKFNPSAKIIIMLRNPVDMIYSLHGLYVRTKNEDIEDFQQALEVQTERMKGFSIPKNCYFPEGLFYTEVAMYHDKIKRFIDVFTRENIHVIVFDDFVQNTAQSYRNTLEFLEVGPNFPAEFDLKKASKVIRPTVLHQLRHSHPGIKKKLSAKVRLDAHEGPPQAPLPPQLRSHLRAIFKEDIEKTSQLIDKDLTYWLEFGGMSDV
jgi:hypothetical protein